MKTKIAQWFIVCCLLISGCVGSLNQPAEDIVIIEEAELPLMTGAEEVSTSVPPTLTAALSEQTNEEVLPTSLPPTPTATRNALEVETFVASLMETNGDCSEPCFWGLIPEETTIREGEDLITGLGNRLHFGQRGSKKYYTTSLSSEDLELSISFLFWEKDGLINNIDASFVPLHRGEILTENLGAFSLQRILEKYGPPADVLFNISFPTEPSSSDYLAYSLELIYPDFAVGYYEYDITSTRPIACPRTDSGLNHIQLWFDKGQIKQRRFPDSEVNLEKVASMTTEAFYQLMLQEPEQACFNLDLSAFGP